MSSTYKDCYELLTSVLAAYRISLHSALNGLTPFEALYGRKPALPCDINRLSNRMNPATIQEYQTEFQQRIQEVQTTIQQIQKAEKQ